jgi:hypothetical protein
MALRHFQIVRRRLADELGIDPDGALVAAHQRILRQELPGTPTNAQLELPMVHAPAQLPTAVPRSRLG